MIHFQNSTKHQQQEKEEALLDEESKLVLYNDDVNTFDFVIDALIEICGHDLIQAEQCTYLIHYKGKCIVKMGSYDTLIPICNQLLSKNLSAQIE